MGLVTPNIGIYVMSAGETNYDQSFLAGMINVDQHDHSGGPNKGVPITTSGLSPFSVTYDKLDSNVVDVTTGIGVNGSMPNQLQLKGILPNIFNLAAVSGFMTKDGILAHARLLTSGNVNRITITNNDGVGGDPVFNIPNIPDLSGINNGGGSFAFQVGGVSQATLTSGLLSLATNNIAISNGNLTTTGGIAPSASFNIPGFILAPNQMYLCFSAVHVGGAGQSQISLVSAGTTLGATGLQNVFGGANPTLSFNNITGQVSITNNAAGALEFQVAWLRLL